MKNVTSNYFFTSKMILLTLASAEIAQNMSHVDRFVITAAEIKICDSERSRHEVMMMSLSKVPFNYQK